MTEGELEITRAPPRRPTGSEAYAAVLERRAPPATPITPAELERSRQQRPDDISFVRAARLGHSPGCGAAIRSDLPRRRTSGASSCPSIAGAASANLLLERVVVAARRPRDKILAAGVEEGDVRRRGLRRRFGFREAAEVESMS